MRMARPDEARRGEDEAEAVVANRYGREDMVADCWVFDAGQTELRC